MKILATSLVCFLLSVYSFGQSEKELIVAVNKAKDTAKITAYLNLAKYYYISTGKGDSLYSIGVKALNLAKKEKSITHQIDALTYIGVKYFVASDYETAISYYIKAVELANKINDSKRLIALHNKIGSLFYNWEKLDLAIPEFLLAAKNAKKINDFDQEAIAYYGISSIYVVLDQNEKRMEYMRKALNIANTKNITDHNKNIVYSSVCQHFLELQSDNKLYIDSAENYATIGLQLATKNNWDYAKPTYLNILGAVAYAKSDFEESNRVTTEVLKYDDKMALLNIL